MGDQLCHCVAHELCAGVGTSASFDVARLSTDGGSVGLLEWITVASEAFSMIDFLYYSMIGAFFTHELDAVKRHEWRILQLLRTLPERLSEQVFIWLHIPLFALLLWGGDGEPESATRVGLAAFSIVHVGLYFVFRRHPAYEFNNPSSWGLILLTGFLGAIYLVFLSAS